ncbi:MAG TPA: TonB-dependent receptor plug domain-containing protein [Chryseosolibacter sp.]
MMLKKYAGILALLLLFSPVASFSQDLDSLLNLSAFTAESELQKALNKGTTVSSSKALTLRETPGIISVMSAEEIQNTGARDLTDLLRLIPGFDIAQDLQFVQGISLRGNWSNEGKVLVMLDGQPFNELLYQTVAIGNRFPVDAIERIEIIRGPGSAIYGGSAEYGVINIITKAAESLNGMEVYGVGGFHSGAVGRTNAGLMLAKRSEKFAIDASVFKGKGIVSDQTFEGYDLASVSNSDPMNLNFGLRAGGLSFRTMYDRFETGDPYQFISYNNFYADLRYTWKAASKLSIIPQLKYYNQVPWKWGDAETGEPEFEARATRMHGQLEAVYDVSRKVNLNFGVLYFSDQATDLSDSEMFGGENTFELNNFAFFAQGLVKHRLFNGTVGFRYEKSNRYDAAFVPRLALTKKIENFHFKVLFSQAFRAPSIQNINLALTGEIKPEKSNVFEAEFGYQFTPEMLLAVNAYSLTTNNILTYGSEGEGADFVEWYENATKMGTRGLELIYNIRKSAWYANFSYSFSRAIGGDQTVEAYIVPQTDKQYAGMLAHKFTLNSSFNVTRSVSFNPSFIYGGKRYAYTQLEENGEGIASQLDPYLLANAFVNFRNVLPGFTAGIGMYDILNEQPPIPQAYNGGYLPIPARGREYVVKISYRLDFKNK